MAEIDPRKRRRLSDSGSFQAEMEAPGSTKVETVAVETPVSPRKPQQRRTLFVRSLPASATTDSLTEYFSQSYPLKHATAVIDRETKQCKGYGFVTFTDAEDTQRALEEFNNTVFEGRTIKVEIAEPRHRETGEDGGKSAPSSTATKLKEEREQRRAEMQPPKLIVRNLPWSIKEPDDLAVLFRSFGKVKHVVIPKKGSVQAGFGFVTLRGKKNAEKALEAINGKEVDGRTLAVDWAVDKAVWEEAQKQEETDHDNVADEEDGEQVVRGPDGDIDMEDSGDSESESDSNDISMDDTEDVEDDEEDEVEDEEDKEDERNASTIFIRNLPFTSTDDSVYEHFAQFGPLRYARVVVDPETERPRGTGFVCFWKVEDATGCLRDAPKQTMVSSKDEDDKKKKKDKSAALVKHSVLENENVDPSGRYTIDGRVLQLSRAVSRTQAVKLEAEGSSRRDERDKDKRRLFLLSEGSIPSNSPLYSKLSETEVKMREASTKQRQTLIKSNPSLHLSLTRLSVRNIPRHVTSKDLKQLAREAVVGFAKDVKAGLRQPLSKEELSRTSDDMEAMEKYRKLKGKGIVKQTKVVFEGREGSKISEKSGAGRSRGYGFIEYTSHRSALMGLRWLNGHAIGAGPAKDPTKGPTKGSNSKEDIQDKKRRLVVEFAIENAQVVARRREHEAKSRTQTKDEKVDGKPKGRDFGTRRGSGQANQGTKGTKRKRIDSGSDDKGSAKTRKGPSEGADDEKDNKLAMRNRIIGRKRMMRKARKGKA